MSPYSTANPFSHWLKKGAAMQLVMNGYKGLSLLVWLNWDIVFTLGTVVIGLLAGAFFGHAILNPLT
jgi:hypothetical protein